MASIIKRSGRWQVKVRKAGYPAVSRTFESEREARIWADQTELAMERGDWVADDHDTEVCAKQLTLSEAMDRFYAEYIVPKRKDPRPEYLRIQRLKKTSLARFRLATLRGKHLTTYITKRRKRVGPDAVRLEIALISKLYNYAISDWNLHALINPAKGINKPAPSDGRERRLAPGEGGAMIGALNFKYALVMCFAIETAMRRAEIARLCWQDIDLRRRVAVIRTSKNKSIRTVPLSRGALAVLEMVPGHTGSVFNLSPDAITREWRRGRQRVGITDLTFHDLRHEAVSRLFEHTDLDMMEIKMISGHKSLSMLARYTHLRVADLVGRLDGQRRGERSAPNPDPIPPRSPRPETQSTPSLAAIARSGNNVVAFRRPGHK